MIKVDKFPYFSTYLKNDEKCSIIVLLHNKLHLSIEMRIFMKDLTKGNIYKTFILFSIPLVLTGVLTMASNLVDTVIAGKFLGENGLAAVGATAAFLELAASVVWGFCSGFSMYVAKLFGEKNYKEIKSSIYCNTIIFALICFIIMIFTIVFRKNIYEFLNIDKTIMKDAGIYFSIYMSGWIFIIFNYMGAFIINAFGISRYPFILSLMATVLNIVGNITTIVIFKLGVAGVAISTVFSAFVVDVFYILKIRQCFKEMNVDKCKIQITTKSIKASVKYSLPVTIQQTVMYVSQMIISVFVNAFGGAATAGYAIATKIYSLNANIYQNSSKTLSNYTAQSLGAGKNENLKKGLRVGFIQGMAFLLPVLFVCVCFASSICSLFFPSGYENISLTYATEFSRRFLPFVVFNMINNLFHAFYRGIASMKFLIISTTIGSVTNFTASFVLIGQYGIYGIFAGWVISWIVEAIFVISVYFSGRWKTEEMKEYLSE